MKKLRIAIVSAIEHTTPYNIGRERSICMPIEIANRVCEGMVAKGHQVTLFATKGSKTKGKLITNDLIPISDSKELKKIYNENKLRFKKSIDRSFWYETIGTAQLHAGVFHRTYTMEMQYLMSEAFYQAKQGKFDLIHILHSPEHAIPFSRLVKTPVVITLHDQFKFPRTLIFNYYKKQPNLYYVSISKDQRQPMPHLQYGGTVYNGTDIKNFVFSEKKGKYLFTAGRIIPKKGFHLAIAASLKSGVPLKFAGNIGSNTDRNYYDQKLKPFLNNRIQYLGTLSHKVIAPYFRNAQAFLFPIKWEEPFGLVMIEAMACGTPVIAFNHGSVPEVVKDGVTGFIVNNVEEMVEAIKKVDQIDRRKCREHVEKNFSVEKMIDNYEKVYYKLAKKHSR
ncbi:MAG: hypothetical protein ACD_68C00087G0002 [uncultured bacterium]|nr:MAG: hypothetical protein ACD_68C00087G0002 [uncultured bacterium]